MLVSSNGLVSAWRAGRAGPERALHQYDIDPPAEFVTHCGQNTGMAKAERLVQSDRRDRFPPADDGDHLAKAELCRARQQRLQQRPADAAPDLRGIDVD